MESTLTTRLPLLPSPSKSRFLSTFPLAGARRVASIYSSSGSVHGFLLSRGGGDAGVTSSVTAAAAAIGEAAEPASEAILLSVQGMMCDGCAASVKRILESQEEFIHGPTNSPRWTSARSCSAFFCSEPEVTSATVDFKEAKAVVWTTPEVKLAEDWQKQCGEKLASHLGTCGFESRAQGQGES